MPGINEVWSLVSGTRSNPPHSPAYGADYAQDGGYYAGQGVAQHGLAAPYAAAGDGTSEVAEYYYEDQYNQQQQNPYGQPQQLQQQQSDEYSDQYGYGDQYSGQQYGEQYSESSSEYYEQQQGYAPGYENGQYGAARPESYGQGQEYQQYETGQYEPAQGQYDSEYSEPTAEFYDDRSYDGPGAPLFGAAASFATPGSATAGAAHAGATALLTELPEAPAESTTAMPAVSPVAPAEPGGVPGPRRGRSAQRPATKSDGAGKPPVTLRTRPRTGPLGRIVQGTVLAALVAGAVTYVAYDKTITLSIDGQSQTVHTFAGTVGAVLTADGVSTGSKDIVSPSTSASASSGQTITVRYGRPLSLSVNGVSTQTWVHYSTVSAALGELGVRTSGAKTSDPLSMDIPRSGLTGLSVYTMRHVTFLVDGKSVPIETTAATVTAAMSQAGITLHNQDAPSVAAASVPTDGETISINRIFGGTETKQVSLPFSTTQVSDSTQYTGTSTVKTQGVDGEETVTYAVLTVNGVKQAPKQISVTVTKQPVDEIVSVGTKALPTSASSLNWTALATCESGDTPSEDTGNGFYGMYQFTISTWDSLGGSGLPSNASAATQTALAEKLYTEAGSGQWPVCGHYLFT